MVGSLLIPLLRCGRTRARRQHSAPLTRRAGKVGRSSMRAAPAPSLVDQDCVPCACNSRSAGNRVHPRLRLARLAGRSFIQCGESHVRGPTRSIAWTGWRNAKTPDTMPRRPTFRFWGTPASNGPAGGAREIVAIRILPPIVIARVGSSPSPMDNYELVIPKPRTGYREMYRRKRWWSTSRTARSKHPACRQARFRDQQNPHSPDLSFPGGLGPVRGRCQDGSADAERSAGAGARRRLRWRARAGNLKAHRRTGDPRDRVEADTGEFST